MTIREWTEKDVIQIAEIEARCFQDAWTVVAFEEVLNYPIHHTFLLEDGGQVCAYACLLVLFEDAELENIAVDLPYRKRGMAKALMDALHEKAKALGAKRCA